jgi:hypothetical protein
MEETERLEASLTDFVAAAWPQIDSSPYQSNWAVEGMCEHLQGVTEGEITGLLINIPFRSGKSLVTSVCWPAWTWARGESTYTSGANVGFLCASYGHSLSLQHSNLTRRLILSPWYQERWGHRFKLRMDQNTKTQFDNDRKGFRISTSVGGVLLGIGAAILTADDPQITEQVESEAELASALTWWREFSTTRLNDQQKTAIVVNMQRLSEADISNEILTKDVNGEWVHYCVPMRYEWQRHCITVLGWQDPRGLDDDDEPLVVIGEDGSRRARDAEALRILSNEREGELMWRSVFRNIDCGPLRLKWGRIWRPAVSSNRQWRRVAQFSKGTGGNFGTRLVDRKVSRCFRRCLCHRFAGQRIYD